MLFDTFYIDDFDENVVQLDEYLYCSTKDVIISVKFQIKKLC